MEYDYKDTLSWVKDAIEDDVERLNINAKVLWVEEDCKTSSLPIEIIFRNDTDMLLYQLLGRFRYNNRNCRVDAT